MPLYQWKINNINIGTNSPTYSSNTFTNGDSINVVLTSDTLCLAVDTAVSNKIKVTVNSLPLVYLGIDTTITTIDTIVLDAGIFDTYFWSDSSILQTMEVPGSIGVGNYLYSVTVTDSNLCSNSDTIEVIVNSPSTDIKENDLFNISIYPSPTKGIVNININNSIQNNLQIEVINLTGKVIYKEQLNNKAVKRQINLAEYSKGIYFIKITNDKESFIKKVVVE